VRAGAVIASAFLTCVAATVAGQTGDAAKILTDARQALGGDSALTAVQTITVIGSLARTVGNHTSDNSLEIAWELPDKFVRTERRTEGSGGPLPSWTITTRDGFAGDVPIHESLAPDAPFPVEISVNPPPQTPADIAADLKKRLSNQRHAFSQYALVLFAASPVVHPVTLTPVGQRPVGNSTADVIDARGPDNRVVRLYVDVKTHLPVMLTWMARPVVVTSSGTTMTAVAVRGGQSMPVTRPEMAPIALPAGDPTAGMPDVEHQMTISDYKVDNGLNWPHRFVDRVNGKVFEDVRLGKFKVNGKINPSAFRIPK
jgi:hypothetical protein